MKNRPRIPLLAKVLVWLALHLLILGLAFFGFVRWQLGFGLDSLLSGSAGARLAGFGDSVVSNIIDVPPPQWHDVIQLLADEKRLTAGIWSPQGDPGFPVPIPDNVDARARASMPPARAEAGPPPRGRDRPPPFEDEPPRGPRPRPDREDVDFAPPPVAATEPESSVFLPKSRPSFLVRGDHGDGYWAGVLIHFPPVNNLPRRPVMLLVRADRLDGSGMFFDFKPWLLGGIAVLSLSLAFWTPFVWGITRYIRRLTAATDQISAGRFQVAIPARGNDELGELGRTIESMAARLDHLVTGQKRFLGDAAHELCAPLARIRTGLGILENRLAETDTTALASIESDVGELAALVNEILAFSKDGNRKPATRRIDLHPLVGDVLVREAADVEAVLDIDPDLTVVADPALLARAIGNLVRNAGIHAGPRAKVSIRAVCTADRVDLTVSDNGPGVPPAELGRIFEPFYRLDRSRSRETGGTGLGLAIVRSAVESFGGEVLAAAAPGAGLAVTLRLPVHVGDEA